MSIKLIEMLESNRVKNRIKKIVDGFFHDAVTTYQKLLGEGELDDEALFNKVYEKVQLEGFEFAPIETFDDVLERAQRPLLLTHEDLVGLFLECFDCGQFWHPRKDKYSFDNLYDGYIKAVHQEITQFRTSGPLEIDLLKQEGRNIEYEQLKLKSENPIWTKNGIYLKVLIYEDDESKEHVFVSIEGEMTENALSELVDTIPFVLSVVLRSMDYLYVLDSEKPQSAKLDWLYRELLRRNPHFRATDLKDLARYQEAVGIYLDSFFSDVSKQDGFNKRLFNAICLMSESDKQKNNAVGLSLAVSAMEAILGERRSDITKNLAENIAVLLESKTEYRPCAINYVKKIYDIRCSTLHGDIVSGESRTRIEARHLLAAIFESVTSRIEFLRRVGNESEVPRDLFKEIKNSLYSGKRVTGINEFNVNMYWREML